MDSIQADWVTWLVGKTEFPLMIFASLIFFIPVYILIKYYRETGIFDYLLFSGAFICASGHISSLILLTYIPPQIFWSLTATLSYNMGLFLLLYHALKIKWDILPQIIRFGTYLQFIIVISIVLSIIILPPDFIKYISILADLNRIFVLLIVIYIYSAIEHVIVDKRTITAQRLWIIAGGVLLISPLILTGINLDIMQLFPFDEIGKLSNLLGIFIVVFITILYPEAVLISRVQLIRALNLYKLNVSLESEPPIKNFAIKTLAEYLQSIPPELLAELKKR
ncbi:MAG: hypothetical protein ACFFC7_31040 [Candidatus Hermodarchaeota archaeon]